MITDFGCCLADKSHGLYLPYNTHDIDKGGNVALMAPEVITAEPGPFTSINYTKADLWTVGTIAYEIFGAKNPFHGDNSKDGSSLKNSSYKEDDLPPLPNHAPPVISALITNLLSRSLYKVLSARRPRILSYASHRTEHKLSIPETRHRNRSNNSAIALVGTQCLVQKRGKVTIEQRGEPNYFCLQYICSFSFDE